MNFILEFLAPLVVLGIGWLLCAEAVKAIRTQQTAVRIHKVTGRLAQVVGIALLIVGLPLLLLSAAMIIIQIISLLK